VIALMHDPTHPGEVLSGWIADLGLSVTAFAKHLGTSRIILSRILNQRAAVTADMALRLSEALGTSPDLWLQMQTQRDLWQARQRASERPHVERLAA
jgi:addiction module HigA family antidote